MLEPGPLGCVGGRLYFFVSQRVFFVGGIGGIDELNCSPLSLCISAYSGRWISLVWSQWWKIRDLGESVCVFGMVVIIVIVLIVVAARTCLYEHGQEIGFERAGLM